MIQDYPSLCIKSHKYYYSMLSRSLDYGPPSYQSVGYGGGSTYNSLPINFPTPAPFSFSNQQANPYSFHKLPQRQYQNYNQNSSRDPSNQNPQNRNSEGKQFIDGFDNNSSSLLNQDKSHARNMKRLLNNDDPTTEQTKNERKNSYRSELQRQIEETRMRKQREKMKIQEQEAERQRKFYEQFKIQAQVKEEKGDKKQQNGYFMIRTLQKFKKSKNQPPQSNPQKEVAQTTANNYPNPPAKGRGKTYQNRSSLDTWENQQNQPSPKKSEQENGNEKAKNLQAEHRFTKLEEEIIKERANEQERLSKLLLFQQRVLQKISDIKVQIRNTALDIDSDKQLQRVRNNLRAKPIPFDQDFFKTNVKKNNFDTNHYYSLPKREIRPLGTRYSVKLKDSPEKSVNSQVTQYVNDKNIKASRSIQQNQQTS